MLKHLPKLKLILLGGDVLLIIAAFYLSYAIRHKELVDVLSFYTSYTRTFALSVLILFFVFYITDVYNFESSLHSTNNIIKIIIAITIAYSLIHIFFYFFSLCYII